VAGKGESHWERESSDRFPLSFSIFLLLLLLLLLNLFSVSQPLQLFSPTQADPSRVHRLLRLPPSSTGLCGVISEKTLRKLAEIRRAGESEKKKKTTTLLVIVTGARMTTLCRRLPFLPACDAVAAEGGGRLFWASSAFPKGGAGEANGNGNGGGGDDEQPSTSSSLPPPTLCDLREDTAWRMRHAAAAGPPSTNEGLSPRQREGALWEVFRRLEEEGWSPDASGYSTSFRLPLLSKSKSTSNSDANANADSKTGDKTEQDLDRVLSSLPPCLSSSRNLGCADIFPATSGKEAVGRHVAATLGVDLRNCCFLCDDDNDLPLAAAVGRAFVVGATHPSVERAIAEAEAEGEDGRFWTVGNGLEGTLAADAAVEAAAEHLRHVLEKEEEEEVEEEVAQARAPVFA